MENYSYIENGTFEGSVTNYSYIENGTFNGTVTNEGANATIKNGTFNGKVENNQGGNITNGTFEQEVINNAGGEISGGTFKGTVLNGNGIITGGTFAAGLSRNDGSVTGGIFNGDTGLTDAHHVTVTNGSVLKVNGVDPRNADGTPGTAWDLYAYAGTTVTITADTEIFSLNHKLLGTDDYVNGNNKIVKFTMPNENVVLNKAITCTNLVMENGWPQASKDGQISCSGTDWSYDKNTKTLTLTSGTFDFSTTQPVQCEIEIQSSRAEITGGTFAGSVTNKGTIKNGSFEQEVTNNAGGEISGGTFAGSVSNNGGTVNGGVFNGKTGLDGVTDLHSITVASNAKIEKVNGVSADWAPYVVTSNATTKEVTITADTEIFSLNGQPIAESSYGVDKKTVTFTMPDDDVVLNSELITKPEPEPEPEPEPKPEPEPTTYTVTVIGGTIDGKTSVSAKKNDTLTVVLDQNEIPDGMTFDMWSISSSKLSGDINVDYRAEAMTFQMPAEDVTIRAQYRSAEIIEDAAPSPLATAATIAVGGAAAGIVVWQGVNLGVDLYLANALPQGVPVPTDRRALALLLWETAGKPEVALPTLYGDIPAEEIELQKATRWAVQNGLMDAADKKDASFFDPDHYVTKMDVFGAWLRLKKLLGTIGTSPTQ